jgi:ribosomal protein S18 acetylase RimI-like enzyme
VTTPLLRPARPGDADALTRLHAGSSPGATAWQDWTATLHADLARRLEEADPELVAFVVEMPNQLVSAAVGFIQPVLCRPGNPLGRSARLASLATHPEFRRRGYAKAVARSFLSEAEAQGCPAVTLTATGAGRHLYDALGFSPDPGAMHLELPLTREPGHPDAAADPLGARRFGSGPDLLGAAS